MLLSWGPYDTYDGLQVYVASVQAEGMLGNCSSAVWHHDLWTTRVVCVWQRSLHDFVLGPGGSAISLSLACVALRSLRFRVSARV